MSTITQLGPQLTTGDASAPVAKKTRRVLRKKEKPPKPIKKWIWLAGHSITLISGLVYLVLYIARFFHTMYWLPRITYRVTFIGVLLAYPITTITTFGVVPNYYTLIATENFQNVLLAVVWFITRPSAFKVVPFLSVTILQLALNFNIKPILKSEAVFTDFIPFTEFVVLIALLFDTLLFRGTSGFALIIYLAFYWLRINFSPYTQVFLLKVFKFIDGKVAKRSEKTQTKWSYIKEFIAFRRNQTLAAIRAETPTEPEIIATAEKPTSGEAVGKAENYQLKGQQNPDPKLAAKSKAGVIVNDVTPTESSYNKSKDEPAATVASGIQATNRSTANSNIPSQVTASGAQVSQSSLRPVNAAQRNQSQQQGQKLPAQQKPQYSTNQLQQGRQVGGYASPSQQSNNIPGVAQASGRISQPQSALPPQQRQQANQQQQYQQYHQAASRAQAYVQQRANQESQQVRSSVANGQFSTQNGITQNQRSY